MSTFEQTSNLGMETFDMSVDFDINAAFQEAMQGVAADTELVLEEKVRRMEAIVTGSASEVYRDFVDFRAMAAQMEIFCNHDHALNQATQGNEVLNGFMDGFKSEMGHDHSGHPHDGEAREDDDNEADSKTSKKKKKRGWFAALLK